MDFFEQKWLWTHCVFLLSQPQHDKGFSSVQAAGTRTEGNPWDLLPGCCSPSSGTSRENFSSFHEHPVLGSDPHNSPSCSTAAALHLAGCVQSTTNSLFCWPCFYLFLVLNRGANDTSSISKNQKLKQIFKRPRCYMLYLT